MGVFQELFDGSIDTRLLDFSYICLVPKKEGARSASDFRPISLINSVQEILSKVLANRLKVIMDGLISHSQAAFLKGRSILDSFATVNEILCWSSKNSLETVGIKADFEKAFDRVRWEFLLKILEWIGANGKWCGWIKQCICNAKVAVLVNGVATKWIKTTRGVRQGDPLPPYLFLLVAEGLARMTERAASNGVLRGIGPSASTKVSLIQYADDTFFFCKAERKMVKKLLFIWQLFEWASDLKINRGKTELFYTGGRAQRRERLAAVLGCKVGSLPIRYLGLPLRVGRLQKEDWGPVIFNVEKRVEGWQAKFLSLGGRLTLVNSVLANVPLYYLSIFLAPKWVLKRIESLRRAFFWKGHAKVSGGQCLVGWKTVCRSKMSGGLGVLSLEDMNLALLTKWWWRFFADKNTT